MNSLNAARKGTLTYGLEHSARRYRRSVRHAALPLDQSPLPSGFAQFPSVHFLPNTALNTDDKQVTSLDTNDKQALVLNRTQLNWLLATFGERDGLLASTSLPGKQASAVQTDGQQPKAKKPAQSSTKSDSQLDNASPQALFARLPPPITVSPPVTTEPDDAVVATGGQWPVDD